MHLLARLPETADDAALSERATAAGLAPAPLSASVQRYGCGPGLVLGFTDIPADTAPAGARRRLAALTLPPCQRKQL
jgi:GntR family transcriptional regulator/MocR family aminotransferase